MIKLEDKKNCCGCTACVQRCPKRCISLKEDLEGFLYPSINVDLCVDCGVCEKVCPIINQNEPRIPLNVYAAKNSDETIRKNSTSGGIFTLLAEYVIDNNGVVFGCGWNTSWEPAHQYTETKEGLSSFRGSKYVQSIVGDTYHQAEYFLKQNRLVLYSGTPCQIAALKLYLRKEYDNLLTIDFICHGVPSPGVFRWYIGEEIQKLVDSSIVGSSSYSSISSYPKPNVLAESFGYTIENIRFRDKRKGWKKYSFTLDVSKETIKGSKEVFSVSYTLKKHVFLRAFLHDLILRPSCYKCPSKGGRSLSDITLGDYWGIYSIKPKLDDDMGVSAVTVNSDRGKQVLHTLRVDLYEVPYWDLCYKNPALLQSTVEPSTRKLFWDDEESCFHTKVRKYCRVSLKQLIKRNIIDFMFFLLGNENMAKVKNTLHKFGFGI